MDDALERAKAVNIVELASRYTKMRHLSGQEYAGPCPKCGGEDRFHATKEWWFCRQCSPKRGDAPGFLQFVENLPFLEAVERLAGDRPTRPAQPVDRRERMRQTMLQTSQGRVPVAPAKEAAGQSTEWRQQAERIVTDAHDALMADNNPGAEYLLGRGLLPHVWEAYNFGFAQVYHAPSDSKLPAIVIPWYRAGKVSAVRYRFLKPPDKRKTTSLRDSSFSGVLFGGQAIAGCAERMRVLVLCEGELNAASIYQVAHMAQTDVLSIGSETATLTPAAVEYISQYRQVIVWMDRPEIARQLMAILPRAVALNSPDGKDANDCLKEGLLGGLIATMRRRGARTREQQEAMVWDYWDARWYGHGDAGADAVARQLASEIGIVYDR